MFHEPRTWVLMLKKRIGETYMHMNNKFIVGVIGTQNTGKSTFIKDILEKFKGTEMEFKTVGCDYRKKIEERGL